MRYISHRQDEFLFSLEKVNIYYSWPSDTVMKVSSECTDVNAAKFSFVAIVRNLPIYTSVIGREWKVLVTYVNGNFFI